ncbi:hypothetical protein QX776_17840 [Alteromonadaceae bacterium BrNp21-10]|nr:hypothetical protein [Alteromonadaceae bacterium BrNp21-10]
MAVGEGLNLAVYMINVQDIVHGNIGNIGKFLGYRAIRGIEGIGQC